MKRHGIHTGLDFKSKSLALVQQHFGKSGPNFYGIARGIDERQVRPDRISKSVGAEDTFVEDIDDIDLAKAELRPLAEKVWRYYQAHDITGKTITVKIKYFDFSQATRGKTVSEPVPDIDITLEIGEPLLASVFPFKHPVRLLGITPSSLNTEESGASATARSWAIVRRPSKRKSLPREEVRQAFRKEPNNGWEEECRCSDRRPLGGGVGRLNSKLCGRRCIASMKPR